VTVITSEGDKELKYIASQKTKDVWQYLQTFSVTDQVTAVDFIGTGQILIPANSEGVISIRLEYWLKTEACHLLRNLSRGKGYPSAAFYQAFAHGKWNGTRKELEMIADGRMHIRGIGEVTRQRLVDLLKEYPENSADYD
jgi:hypothetical protein